MKEKKNMNRNLSDLFVLFQEIMLPLRRHSRETFQRSAVQRE